MDTVAPLLLAVRELRFSMGLGENVAHSLEGFVAVAPVNELTDSLRVLHSSHHRGLETLPEMTGSTLRRLFYQTLWSGLNGSPIYQRLCDLEVEIHAETIRQLDAFVQRLPFLGLLPLFGCFLPAVLLVLLGPLFVDLISQMGEIR